MTLDIHTALLLVGAILMVVSSLGIASRVNLFHLAWAFVILAFVF